MKRSRPNVVVTLERRSRRLRKHYRRHPAIYIGAAMFSGLLLEFATRAAMERLGRA